MGIRRQAREVAIQALYMSEFTDLVDENSLNIFYSNFNFSEVCREFSSYIIFGVLKEKKKIDSIISSSSTNWPLNRMSRVDRAILRVSVFELCFMQDIPYNVSINEAIEIAKKFSSDDSPMFINELLDRVAKNSSIQDSKRLEAIEKTKSENHIISDSEIEIATQVKSIKAL